MIPIQLLALGTENEYRSCWGGGDPNSAALITVNARRHKYKKFRLSEHSYAPSAKYWETKSQALRAQP